VRVRGGNLKHRALRLDSGNFSWATEGVARKTRVIVVVFHPSNNELVRTNTLTRSAIVQVDAHPFSQWYKAHYGLPLGRRRAGTEGGAAATGDDSKDDKDKTGDEKKSQSVQRKQATRARDKKIPGPMEKQFESGRLLACISSRPGQSGRCDGYILEGEELTFYQRALRK